MEKLYYCFNMGAGLWVTEMRTMEKQKGTKEYWESFYGESGGGFKLEEVEDNDHDSTRVD